MGTSGFGYPSWRGPFYPARLPAADMLAYYARAFATVEVNQTFQRVPPPSVADGWRAQTPSGFRLALKAPQTITHYRRLRNVDDVIAELRAFAHRLGPRRGPLLFQLPANFRADHARLAAFLALLRPADEAALEFRHPSWLDDATWALCRRARVAVCWNDGEVSETPRAVTAPFGYVRLRRPTYGPAALERWARELRGVSAWRRVWVYLRHDDAGLAPRRARRLVAALGRLR